jgi:hypothetical protein
MAYTIDQVPVGGKSVKLSGVGNDALNLSNFFSVKLPTKACRRNELTRHVVQLRSSHCIRLNRQLKQGTTYSFISFSFVKKFISS